MYGFVPSDCRRFKFRKPATKHKASTQLYSAQRHKHHDGKAKKLNRRACMHTQTKQSSRQTQPKLTATIFGANQSSYRAFLRISNIFFFVLSFFCGPLFRCFTYVQTYFNGQNSTNIYSIFPLSLCLLVSLTSNSPLSLSATVSMEENSLLTWRKKGLFNLRKIKIL